jgi:hypothetical protein
MEAGIPVMEDVFFVGVYGVDSRVPEENPAHE